MVGVDTAVRIDEGNGLPARGGDPSSDRSPLASIVLEPEHGGVRKRRRHRCCDLGSGIGRSIVNPQQFGGQEVDRSIIGGAPQAIGTVGDAIGFVVGGDDDREQRVLKGSGHESVRGERRR